MEPPTIQHRQPDSTEADVRGTGSDLARHARPVSEHLDRDVESLVGKEATLARDEFRVVVDAGPGGADADDLHHGTIGGKPRMVLGNGDA
jgi:hypothetical protein